MHIQLTVMVVFIIFIINMINLQITIKRLRDSIAGREFAFYVANPGLILTPHMI